MNSLWLSWLLSFLGFVPSTSLNSAIFKGSTRLSGLLQLLLKDEHLGVLLWNYCLLFWRRGAGRGIWVEHLGPFVAKTVTEIKLYLRQLLKCVLLAAFGRGNFDLFSLIALWILNLDCHMVELFTHRMITFLFTWRDFLNFCHRGHLARDHNRPYHRLLELWTMIYVHVHRF